MKAAGIASALAAFTLVCAASAQQVPATYHPSTRDEHIIEALELEWLNHEHDRVTLERILADDFVHPVATGVFLTKEQHIDWAVKHPEREGRVQKFEEFRVRIYGETAVASGIVLDTNASGGDARRTVFTDVFVRRDQLWRAVNAQENPVSPAP